MSESSEIYNSVFRALLTEEALDKAGRLNRHQSDADDPDLIKTLSIDALDEQHVAAARRMSSVYTVIAAFENSVREFIAKRLLDEVGENWWAECVSKNIREQAEKRMEEERSVRWHTQRGDEPINFTMLKQLLSIIRQNHDHFVPFIPTVEWAEGIFDAIERSRNVIMHSGQLDAQDLARLGVFVRDWTTQVAT